MEEKDKYRHVVFYGEQFQYFFDAQNNSIQNKIIWTFALIEELPRVPVLFLKHLEGTKGLYEIRVHTDGTCIRIFCFFDAGQLVIVTSAYEKKEQKTSKKEIQKALQLKAAYEEENYHRLP